VTAAVNGLNPKKDPYFATLDIAGYNYAVGGDHWENSLYELDHKRVPDRIMYCSESYPLHSFGAWMAVEELPYVFGDYVWTGFDYLGEASIGWMGYSHVGSFYPWMHAFCGDIDICGFKRPQSYYRDVLWMDDQVSIFVHPPVPSFDMTNPEHQEWSKWNWHDVVADWNWPDHEEEVLQVDVYSSCPEVELFLNGESLGKEPSSIENQFTPSWLVEWIPGELKAVGYTDGAEKAVSILKTAKDPVQVTMKADNSILKANGQDLSFIVVELVDEENIRNPKAQNLVEFTISGPGTIAAVGSSNPFGLESFRLPRREAYQGRCLVIVKAAHEPGEIILQATSEGMNGATLNIVAE
jgi:beta-galactosidase